ncbi:PP2C family serine/threonine-protein phosphatase [Candidatus Methylomicrobium oryzae]|uniref:PP2C family serine/threonine-protein phosphatase n=1 Tax=Candidatus Methylomicrobium oryzae TaxID=2802053 RepID=UPI0019232247|nr:PP2C family serine/threonine-protein phosphatase [Methylomicrobium sp. RS1]MBL1263463.1 protein phosphatase 2C domain-containing protein [Methylomicrobium sp. RS1]
MTELDDKNGDLWRIVAASCCGVSHEKLDIPCQDANCWEVNPSGVLVFAVADGAGSASLAEIGSAIATRTSVEIVRSELDRIFPTDDKDYEMILEKGLVSAQIAIETEAKIRSVNIQDMATTLILVIALSNVIAAIQIGDGAVVAGDQLNNIIPITSPKLGEYINETTFITSAGAIETAQFSVWRGEVAYLAAFSDGLQMLALEMPEGIPHSPFFSPIFSFLSEMDDVVTGQKELETFLSSARVRERTDDDLTLLLAKLTN